jgi:hypothetical protein
LIAALALALTISRSARGGLGVIPSERSESRDLHLKGVGSLGAEFKKRRA